MERKFIGTKIISNKLGNGQYTYFAFGNRPVGRPRRRGETILSYIFGRRYFMSILCSLAFSPPRKWFRL
jgi:hypothetical protein